jgi:uncharacterized membrane protein
VRCDEASFESSVVGKWVYAFCAVFDMLVFCALCGLAAQLGALLAPALRAEIAVLAWIGVHVGLGYMARRWGQAALTRIAVDAFHIDPNAASSAPGAP